MFESLSNFFERKAAPQSGPLMPEPLPNRPPLRREPSERKPTFSRAFRWRLPSGQTAVPASVEVVGTFTQWQKVPLTRDSALDAWQVTIHQIQGHRTHHYMILVDGKPVYDKNCDGLAIPHGPEEEHYQIMTDKGPRVFMLFAQTK